jgi:hypothetical protein
MVQRTILHCTFTMDQAMCTWSCCAAMIVIQSLSGNMSLHFKNQFNSIFLCFSYMECTNRKQYR